MVQKTCFRLNSFEVIQKSDICRIKGSQGMMISATLCFNWWRFEWRLVARGLRLAEKIINDQSIFIVSESKNSKSDTVNNATQCVKRFFWSVFSCIQTEYRKIRTRKKTLYLDSFHAVIINKETLQTLRVHYCRFENLSIYLCLYKNNA